MIVVSSMFKPQSHMISTRRADLINTIKDQRQKISLITVLFNNNNEDYAYFWIYDDKGQHIALSSYDNFLYNVMLNAMLASNLNPGFNTRFVDNINFSEDLEAFNAESYATNNARLASIYSNTMTDFHKALKISAPAFVGKAEHYFNDKGTCFGIIELFKPKFIMGQMVRFKTEDGEMHDGMVTGLNGSHGTYSVLSNTNTYEVKEKSMQANASESLSFRRQSDLGVNLLEKQRQKEEEDRIDTHPLDSLPEHPKLNELIKDICEQFGHAMTQKYETYGNEIEPLPHESGPGFHCHINGGWRSVEYTLLNHMQGSGYWPDNEDFRAAAEQHEAEASKEAHDRFIHDFGNDLRAAGIDPSIPEQSEKINYHDLYEMGQGKLAERLSEIEDSCLSDYSYTFTFSVQYYAPDNRYKQNEEGKPEVYVISEVRGSYSHTAVEESIVFSTMTELREALTKCLNQAIEALG